jgi:hypothetical protein
MINKVETFFSIEKIPKPKDVPNSFVRRMPLKGKRSSWTYEVK